MQTFTKNIAVLFCRVDSIYKSIPDLDVYDINRDAKTYQENNPVIAHPPCRAWGRLRHLANPRPGEKELAIYAVDQIRKHGGVLEHPVYSTLWNEIPLPRPGTVDHFGGWTLPVSQKWWGHKAEKQTYLYIVGCTPDQIPSLPFDLAPATHIVAPSGRNLDGTRLHKGDAGWRPHLSHADRERTPVQFALWLVDLARIIQKNLDISLNPYPVGNRNISLNQNMEISL